MKTTLWYTWLASIVALAVWLGYQQLQCIDCTRMRIIADNWPAYVAVLAFGAIVYLVFRVTER